MSSSYQWYLVAHVIGWVMWVGGLVGLTMLLASHRNLAESTVKDLVGLERAVALEMDIGATLAILFGVVLILQGRNMGDAWVMKKGWMHVKLTMVVGLIGVHGYIRAVIGAARRGEKVSASPIVRALTIALVIGIIVMVIARPIGDG